MCEILKRHGFRVEHLSDNKKEGRYDITLNGIPADLKCMSGSGNIIKRAHYAIRKQGAKLIVFQFMEWNDKYKQALSQLSLDNIHGYYFIDNKNDLKSF
ncbi:MAG: hypothetical protein MJ204_05730 [Bacteroidales bacterium]|nr:hypothetical protein [Bacteroidales bacterium]MCQ2607122.1 hypothetical protein [Bacteroidales bacterium]